MKEISQCTVPQLSSLIRWPILSLDFDWASPLFVLIGAPGEGAQPTASSRLARNKICRPNNDHLIAGQYTGTFLGCRSQASCTVQRQVIAP